MPQRAEAKVSENKCLAQLKLCVNANKCLL